MLGGPCMLVECLKQVRFKSDALWQLFHRLLDDEVTGEFYAKMSEQVVFVRWMPYDEFKNLSNKFGFDCDTFLENMWVMHSGHSPISGGFRSWHSVAFVSFKYSNQRMAVGFQLLVRFASGSCMKKFPPSPPIPSRYLAFVFVIVDIIIWFLLATLWGLFGTCCKSLLSLHAECVTSLCTCTTLAWRAWYRITHRFI